MAFVRVATASEIPVGHGTHLDVNGVSFALFNAGGGRFHAMSSLCPHEDGPLAEGWLEGDVVVCPWHGFDFELSSGKCRVDEALSIAVYRVRVVGDAVEVDLP